MTLRPLSLDLLEHVGPKPDYETSYRLAAWIESHRSSLKGPIPSHFDPVGTALRGESEGVRIMIGSTGLEQFVVSFWVARTDDWQILIGGHETDVRHRFFDGDAAAFRAWFDDLDARGLMPRTHATHHDAVVSPMRLSVVVGRQSLDVVVDAMRDAHGPWAIHQNGAFGHPFYNVSVVREEDALLAAAVSTSGGTISGVGFPSARDGHHPTDEPLATDETVRAGVPPVPFDFAAHDDPEDHPLTEYAPSVVVANLIAYARANDVRGVPLWNLIVRANPGASFGVGPDGEAVRDGGVDYPTGEMCAEIIGDACHDEAEGARGLLDEEDGERVVCTSEAFVSLLERRVVDQHDIRAYVVRDGRLYCLDDE